MTTPDANDLNSLLDRYERPLIRYAQSIVGDLENARDIVQDTFIRYVRLSEADDEGTPPNSQPAVPDAGEGRHLEAWLFTVTRNRALDHLRKFSRIIPMPIPEDRQSLDPGPDEQLATQDAADWLLRLLDELTPNQRDVVRLKFQNDLSYQEIALITGLSATNVGFLLHVGLKKLRSLLQNAPAESIPFTIRKTYEAG